MTSNELGTALALLTFFWALKNVIDMFVKIIRSAREFLRPKPTPLLVWDTENPAVANYDHFMKLWETTTGANAKQVLHQFALDLASIIIVLVSLTSSNYFETALIMRGTTISHGDARIYTMSVAALLQPTIRATIERAVSPLVTLTDTTLLRMEAFHKKIIEASNPILDHLTLSARDALGRIDRDIAESIRMLKAGTVPTNEYKSMSAIFDLLQYRNCVRLAQPRSCQNYFETCDLNLRAQTLARLPESMRLPIKAITNHAIATSIRGDSNNRRCQGLILGKPGVGKSSLSKLIGQFLGAAYLCFVQDDLDLHDISGEPHFLPKPRRLPGELDALRVQGAIRDGVRETARKNPLLVIEEYEPHRTMHAMATVKTYNRFFDPEVESSSAGFENLEHIFLFVLSNAKLEEFNPATINRFFIVEAADLNDAQFSDIFDTVQQESKDMLQMSMGLKPPNQGRSQQPLTAKFREMNPLTAEMALEAAVEQVKRIKSEILGSNKDPGAREIQRVTQLLIDHIFVEILLAEDKTHEVSAEEIKAISNWILLKHITEA